MMTSWTAAGAVIDEKYRVERMLGRGGMGVVVAARHLTLGHSVAIKFPLASLASRPDAAARILREARASMLLRSEHVARVFDVGVHPEAGPFLVMEYLVGQDLAAHVATRGPLSLDAALQYTIQACEALAEAHAHHIIHRDFKPSNLFLSQSADGSPLVKIIDFGLAKRLAHGDSVATTASGAVLGSPLFMAPEQMRGDGRVDPCTDVWAVGATMFALLRGAPPFSGKSLVAVYDNILAGPPRLRDARPDIPADVEAIIQRCLRPVSAERFQNVADLTEAIAAVDPARLAEPAARVRRIHRRFDAVASPENEPDVSEQVGQITATPADASWRDAGPDFSPEHMLTPGARSSSAPARAAATSRWPVLVTVLSAVLLVGYVATSERRAAARGHAPTPTGVRHAPSVTLVRAAVSVSSASSPAPAISPSSTALNRALPKPRSVAPAPAKSPPLVVDPLAEPD